MGGSASRPRNGFRKTAKSGFGVFIQLRSNPFPAEYGLIADLRAAIPPGGSALASLAPKARKNFSF